MLYVLTVLTGLAGDPEADKITILRGQYATLAACMTDATAIVADPAIAVDRWVKATCKRARDV